MSLESYEFAVEYADNSSNGRAIITCSTSVSIKFYQKLLKEMPKDVKLIALNDDGSFVCSVPKTWVKFPKPPKTKTVTEEQKKAFSERVKKMWEERKANANNSVENVENIELDICQEEDEDEEQ